MISGTTFAFVESIGLLIPLTFAEFFPIQSSILLLPKVTVTFFAAASHTTFPPRPYTTALIGRIVLPFLMTGGESRYFVCPFSVK